MSKKQVNEKKSADRMYEDALESAEMIYELAVSTAKDGIMEELEPKIKRFVSRKLQSEADDDELEDDELENILGIDEGEEEEEDEENIEDVPTEEDEENIEDEPSPEEPIVTVDPEVDSEIEIDLSDILSDLEEPSDDNPEEEEEEQTDESVQIEENGEEEDEEELEESAECKTETNEEDEDDDEGVDIEKLVNEIDDEEEDEIEIEIVDEADENPELGLNLDFIDGENDEEEEALDDIAAKLEKENESLKMENKKLKTGISLLKEKVDEYVLVNKKLKLISKTFALNNFSRKEKMKIIESFDKAKGYKDSVKIYETVKNAVDKVRSKKRISEGASSKVIGTTRPPRPKENILKEQDDSLFKKWGRLSGAKKGSFLED